MRYSILLVSSLALTFACTSEPVKEAPAEPVKEAAAATEKADAAPKAAAPVGDCTYSITEAKPGWTAFKFTEKAPVGGTFNTVKMNSGAEAATLTEALKGLTMEIDGASIDQPESGLSKREWRELMGVLEKLD